MADMVQVTAFIDKGIADAIVSNYGDTALDLVEAYYILDAAGGSKVGGEVTQGGAKIFLCFCSSQPVAVQVKDRIMGLVPAGRSIGFTMTTVQAFVFPAK